MLKQNLEESMLQIQYCCDLLQQYTKNKEVKNFLKDKSLNEIMIFKKEAENFVFNDDKIETNQIKNLFNLDLKKLNQYFHVSNNKNIKFNYGIQGIHVVNKEDSNILLERANIRKDKESTIYKIDCFNPKKELIIDKDIGWYDAKNLYLIILTKITNEYNKDLEIGPEDIHYIKNGVEIPLKVDEKKVRLFSNMGNGCSKERHFIDVWKMLFGKKETDYGRIKYKNECESKGKWSYIITPQEIAGFYETQKGDLL